MHRGKVRRKKGGKEGKDGEEKVKERVGGRGTPEISPCWLSSKWLDGL